MYSSVVKPFSYVYIFLFLLGLGVEDDQSGSRRAVAAGLEGSGV